MMKRRFIAIATLLLLLASAPRNFSQRTNNPPVNKDVPVRELLKLPGRVIGETKAARPEGDLKLTGYRVEELNLPKRLTVEVKGQQVAVDKAWRLTLKGGPFPVRAMPAIIWIDDEIVGNGIENETLSEVTAITFDSSLIREGSVVSITYGEDKETRAKLSHKLKLNREGENQ